MAKYLSVDEIITKAKERGIDFGKGDPYNRLRYYTKIGWLPNMKRLPDEEGNVKGHYPLWALEIIFLVEDLKEKGFSNDEISRRVQTKNKFQNLKTIILSKETRNQLIMYGSALLLILIFANESGLITLGKSKTKTLQVSTFNDLPAQFIDSGQAFVPSNSRSIFIKTPLVKNTSKVYLSFTDDYSPATRYWVGNIKEYEGFEVDMDAPVFSNAEFNWWITN